MKSPQQDSDKTTRFDVKKGFYAREQDAYSSLNKGSYFGRYLINRELGRGGMGIVYEAYDPQMQRVIALKVIMNKDLGDRERFLKESQAVAQLNHANIVRFYEFGDFPQLHFTMEYIHGLPLSNLIKDRRMKPNFLVTILRQICQACEHAHRSGILHRDIKPANVIVTKEGQAKLLDFGLAKNIHAQDDLTNTGEALGTAYYMAPEQLQGNPNKRSDIYSFGATLYEALTWRTVYQGTTNINIIVQILEKPPIPPHQLNPEVCPYLEAICLKALSRNPARRYESFRQLDQELKNYQHKRPILARKYTKWDTLSTMIKQHMLLFSFLAIFITTVFGFSVFLVIAYEKLESKEAQLQTTNQELKHLNRAMIEALDYARHSEDHHELFFDMHFLKPLKRIFQQSSQLKTAKEYEFLRGLVLGQTGDKEDIRQAIIDYNNVIAKDPGSPLSYYNRALLYEKTKEYPKALDDYNTSIRLNSGYARAFYNRGRIHEELEDHNAAIADYTKALALNPRFYQAHHNRGRLYMVAKDYAQAASDLKKAIALNGEYHRAYATQGELLERQGKLDASIKSYSTAISIKPSIYYYYINRGYVYRLQKQLSFALRDYQHAMRIEPDNYLAYTATGVIYQMKNNSAKAVHYYTKALKLNSRDANTRLSRGILFQLAGKMDKALSDYSRALRDDPQNAEGYYLRGGLYIQKTKFRQALSDWKSAVKLGHVESARLRKEIPQLEEAIRQQK
ncbi:serine/threonine-protein kinase [Candidatus Uabimicrobium amorphum]|uniref:non-specific serine/threonine protein kinase n=1 Tax=Uabimicrobium amorphum TaxID=2596890 RepID=A0A5S9F225_UABAM|nr:serine/threonine-protein kinase [Candidatus Uabimicrobium amorphum]BBM83012.1 serine/threonine protein kinase [Candidatus Uabimicrobium amorphum]